MKYESRLIITWPRSILRPGCSLLTLVMYLGGVLDVETHLLVVFMQRLYLIYIYASDFYKIIRCNILWSYKFYFILYIINTMKILTTLKSM